MKTAFDSAAASYDLAFTHSVLGMAQREVVRAYLQKNVLTDQSIHILELNGGTGEDALFFSGSGHKVLCTDISGAMVESAGVKAASRSGQPIEFRQMDLADKSQWPEDQFDLIFSNFGGLNCISPSQLREMLGHLPCRLRPGGQFVAVVMPRFCLSESLYFLVSMRWTKVFRRMTRKRVTAHVGDDTVAVWYYHPRDFIRGTGRQLTLAGLCGIGTFLPPSYLENKFRHRPLLLGFLNKLDGIFRNRRHAAVLSDHFLIHLKKRP